MKNMKCIMHNYVHEHINFQENPQKHWESTMNFLHEMDNIALACILQSISLLKSVYNGKQLNQTSGDVIFISIDRGIKIDLKQLDLWD